MVNIRTSKKIEIKKERSLWRIHYYFTFEIFLFFFPPPIRLMVSMVIDTKALKGQGEEEEKLIIQKYVNKIYSLILVILIEH